MSDADSGEKSHEPTQKRLEDARRKGDIAKSADVTTAAGYLGLFLCLTAAGGGLAQASGEALARLIDQADALAPTVLGPGGAALAARAVSAAVLPLLPIILLPAALVLLALFGQNAFVFAPDKIKPKGSRLSPLSNAKQKYGLQGLVEFAKSAAKLTAVSATLLFVLSGEADRLVGAVRAAPAAAAALMGIVLIKLLSGVMLIALVVASVDYFWQRHLLQRRLRMSHKELRDEVKDSEGDPALKAQRRQRGVDIATNRMLADVPTADVVIVNPTHFAVALKWSRTPGSAPVCVAKGQDEVAARIRDRAAEAGVPIYRDPPTARSIHAVVKVGEMIRPEMYRAVAAAIHFSETMRTRARQRG